MINIPFSIFDKYGKMFFMFIILLFTSFFAYAQDKIYNTDKSIIEVKVIEIIEGKIKFKKFKNQEGPLYTISTDNVEMIVFANGEKEIFNKGVKQEDSSKDFVKKDSLQCIEDMWGVKFENTPLNGGGVMIVKLEANSVFLPQTSLAKLYIFNVSNGTPVRVKNTSELARAVFASYNQGVSKIKMGSGSRLKLSSFTKDHWGFDVSGISKCQSLDSINKKLGIKESRTAGGKVEGIYNPEKIGFAMPGFCSGLLFGLPGIVLVGGAALLAPGVKYLPAAPPNVDSNAWSAGFKSKVRKKRLIGGILGSAVGAFLVIGAFSSVN